MTSDLRALSLWRPWPWAIFDIPDGDGPKTIENRNWACPIWMIGRPLAIHAGKKFDDAAISMFLRLGFDPPARYDSYPDSAIIGVVTIDRVVTTSRTLGAAARWFFETRDDGKDNYGWVLTNRRKLAEPVPCRGMQGLWRVPGSAYEAIRTQLGGLE